MTIEGDAHTSFASVAEPAMRFMDNPNSLGCSAIMQNVDVDVDGLDNPFPALGGPPAGVEYLADGPPPCGIDPVPKSIHPGRQHVITLVAARSL